MAQVGVMTRKPWSWLYGASQGLECPSCGIPVHAQHWYPHQTSWHPDELPRDARGRFVKMTP